MGGLAEEPGRRFENEIGVSLLVVPPTPDGDRRSGLGVGDLPAEAPLAIESPTHEEALPELAAPGDKDMLNESGEFRNLFPDDVCRDDDAVIISIAHSHHQVHSNHATLQQK